MEFFYQFWAIMNHNRHHLLIAQTVTCFDSVSYVKLGGIIVTEDGSNAALSVVGTRIGFSFLGENQHISKLGGFGGKGQSGNA
jgi:hypothetical protein